jgi:uncharacterized membrane protein
VLFAVLLVVLIGMVGLVVDGAILTSTYRQAQNAADAAALAAAFDRMRGQSLQTATATATTFVQVHNGLANAPAPTVNEPPASGAYAGRSNYVEVIVTAPVQTYLVHIVGVARNQQVQPGGRGLSHAGEGDSAQPHARPGLQVSGGTTVSTGGYR